MEVKRVPRVTSLAVRTPNIQGVTPIVINTVNSFYNQPSFVPAVITDPLLNIEMRNEYRREFERTIATELAGRALGTAIGAGAGAVVGGTIGAIISGVATLFTHGAAGASIKPATALGAKIGTAIGGGVGFGISDYTTYHASAELAKRIADEYRQGALRGAMTTLYTVGKSMDVLQGGEAIRSVIYSAVTGTNVIDNIGRAYGLSMDGRMNFDTEIIREELGIDLGSIPNIAIDLVGDLITDPGFVSSVGAAALSKTASKTVGAALKEEKLYTAVAENAQVKNIVNTANALKTTVKNIDKSLPQKGLIKATKTKFYTAVLDNDVDYVAKVVLSNMPKDTKDISLEVINKFVVEARAAAFKSTSSQMYTILKTFDTIDDMTTARLFEIFCPPLAVTKFVVKHTKSLISKRATTKFKDALLGKARSYNLDELLNLPDEVISEVKIDTTIQDTLKTDIENYDSEIDSLLGDFQKVIKEEASPERLNKIKQINTDIKRLYGDRESADFRLKFNIMISTKPLLLKKLRTIHNHIMLFNKNTNTAADQDILAEQLIELYNEMINLDDDTLYVLSRLTEFRSVTTFLSDKDNLIKVSKFKENVDALTSTRKEAYKAGYDNYNKKLSEKYAPVDKLQRDLSNNINTVAENTYVLEPIKVKYKDQTIDELFPKEISIQQAEVRLTELKDKVSVELNNAYKQIIRKAYEPLGMIDNLAPSSMSDPKKANEAIKFILDKLSLINLNLNDLNTKDFRFTIGKLLNDVAVLMRSDEIVDALKYLRSINKDKLPNARLVIMRTIKEQLEQSITVSENYKWLFENQAQLKSIIYPKEYEKLLADQEAKLKKEAIVKEIDAGIESYNLYSKEIYEFKVDRLVKDLEQINKVNEIFKLQKADGVSLGKIITKNSRDTTDTYKIIEDVVSSDMEAVRESLDTKAVTKDIRESLQDFSFNDIYSSTVYSSIKILKKQIQVVRDNIYDFGQQGASTSKHLSKEIGALPLFIDKDKEYMFNIIDRNVKRYDRYLAKKDKYSDLVIKNFNTERARLVALREQIELSKFDNVSETSFFGKFNKTFTGTEVLFSDIKKYYKNLKTSTMKYYEEPSYLTVEMLALIERSKKVLKEKYDIVMKFHTRGEEVDEIGNIYTDILSQFNLMVKRIKRYSSPLEDINTRFDVIEKSINEINGLQVQSYILSANERIRRRILYSTPFFSIGDKDITLAKNTENIVDIMNEFKRKNPEFANLTVDDITFSIIHDTINEATYTINKGLKELSRNDLDKVFNSIYHIINSTVGLKLAPLTQDPYNKLLLEQLNQLEELIVNLSVDRLVNDDSLLLYFGYSIKKFIDETSVLLRSRKRLSLVKEYLPNIEYTTSLIPKKVEGKLGTVTTLKFTVKGETGFDKLIEKHLNTEGDLLSDIRIAVMHNEVAVSDVPNDLLVKLEIEENKKLSSASSMYIDVMNTPSSVDKYLLDNGLIGSPYVRDVTRNAIAANLPNIFRKTANGFDPSKPTTEIFFDTETTALNNGAILEIAFNDNEGNVIYDIFLRPEELPKLKDLGFMYDSNAIDVNGIDEGMLKSKYQEYINNPNGTTKSFTLEEMFSFLIENGIFGSQSMLIAQNAKFDMNVLAYNYSRSLGKADFLDTVDADTMLSVLDESPLDANYVDTLTLFKYLAACPRYQFGTKGSFKLTDLLSENVDIIDTQYDIDGVKILGEEVPDGVVERRVFYDDDGYMDVDYFINGVPAHIASIDNKFMYKVYDSALAKNNITLSDIMSDAKAYTENPEKFLSSGATKYKGTVNATSSSYRMNNILAQYYNIDIEPNGEMFLTADEVYNIYDDIVYNRHNFKKFLRDNYDILSDIGKESEELLETVSGARIEFDEGQDEIQDFINAISQLKHKVTLEENIFNRAVNPKASGIVKAQRSVVFLDLIGNGVLGNESLYKIRSILNGEDLSNPISDFFSKVQDSSGKLYETKELIEDLIESAEWADSLIGLLNGDKSLLDIAYQMIDESEKFLKFNRGLSDNEFLNVYRNKIIERYATRNRLGKSLDPEFFDRLEQRVYEAYMLKSNRLMMFTGNNISSTIYNTIKANIIDVYDKFNAVPDIQIGNMTMKDYAPELKEFYDEVTIALQDMREPLRHAASVKRQYKRIGHIDLSKLQVKQADLISNAEPLIIKDTIETKIDKTLKFNLFEPFKDIYNRSPQGEYVYSGYVRAERTSLYKVYDVISNETGVPMQKLISTSKFMDIGKESQIADSILQSVNPAMNEYLTLENMRRIGLFRTLSDQDVTDILERFKRCVVDSTAVHNYKSNKLFSNETYKSWNESYNFSQRIFNAYAGETPDNLMGFFKTNKEFRLVKHSADYTGKRGQRALRINTNDFETMSYVLANPKEFMVVDTNQFDNIMKEIPELSNSFVDAVSNLITIPFKVLSLALNIPFLVTNLFSALFQNNSYNHFNLGKTVNTLVDTSKDYNKWKYIYTNIFFNEFIAKENGGTVALTGKWASEIQDSNSRLMQSIMKHDKKLYDMIINLDSAQRTKILDLDEILSTNASFGELKDIQRNKELAKYKQDKYEKLLKSKDTDDNAMREFKVINENPNDGFNTLQEEYTHIRQVIKNKGLTTLDSDMYRRKNVLKRLINKEKFSNKIDISSKITQLPILKQWFGLNNDIETVFRASMIRDVMNQGGSLAEGAQEVVERHFVYNDKSLMLKAFEMFVPFATYPIKAGKLFSSLTQDAEFTKVVYNYLDATWGSEDDELTNDYLLNRKAKGDIPIGDYLFSLGNPFLESLGTMINPLEAVYNKAHPIIKGTVDAFAESEYSSFTQMPIYSKINNIIKNSNNPVLATGVMRNYYSSENYRYTRMKYTQKPIIYKNLYTRTGYSRVGMRMSNTNINNVQYRVNDILYKRKRMK